MSELTTSPDGFRYRVDSTGTIHQVAAVPIAYDSQYIADRYLPNVIPTVTLESLAHLRWGHFLGLVGNDERPERVLDWGYGAGAFLRVVSNTRGCSAAGFDISGWPIPANCRFEAQPLNQEWDAVTFFDVLEHIEDLSFLHDLRTKWLVVTVPWGPAMRGCEPVNWDSFWTWKHRRPNEHLHHWNSASLRLTLIRYGFNVINFAAIEDVIRRAPGPAPNILTVTARKL